MAYYLHPKTVKHIPFVPKSARREMRKRDLAATHNPSYRLSAATRRMKRIGPLGADPT